MCSGGEPTRSGRVRRISCFPPAFAAYKDVGGILSGWSANGTLSRKLLEVGLRYLCTRRASSGRNPRKQVAHQRTSTAVAQRTVVGHPPGHAMHWAKIKRLECMDEFLVYYDDQCEVCQAGVSWLRFLDRRHLVRPVALSSATLPASLLLEDCLRELHVVTPTQTLVGWDAVVRLAR